MDRMATPEFYLRTVCLCRLGHLLGLRWIRPLSAFFVMVPERGFCEAAIVPLVLILVGIVPRRFGSSSCAATTC